MDFRYAVRTMRRSPGFTAVAVLSLALAIGANSAVFSLIDMVMLRPLPVRKPGRLVELLHRFPGEPRLNGYSWRAYQYLLEHNHVLSGLIGVANAGGPRPWSFELGGAGLDSERVDGAYVTGSYFPVLGLRPAAGRLIGPEDDRPGAPEVAVVSWAWWKARLNSHPEVVGRQILVDHAPVTIVGVAGRGFSGLRVEDEEKIWMPLGSRAPRASVALLGRLKPGVTFDQAQAELTVLFEQAVKNESNRFLHMMRFELAPAGTGISTVRDQLGRPLTILIALAGLMLLLACINLAGLLLARGAARQRELAVRISLGATPLRLARQALTESLLLSAAGAAAGALLASFGTNALLRTIASARRPITLHVTTDLRVLLFTIGLALLTGVLFGLAPAARAWASAPAAPLRDGGRGGETKGQRVLGRALVAAQVAFSLALLSAAALFAGHLESLYAGLGFQRDHVLIVTLNPAHSGFSREQLAQPYRELLARFAAIPGVRSATLSGVTPIQGAGANRDATVEGYRPAPGEPRYLVENWVAPRYFETLGQPLLAGRDFHFGDEGRPLVAIVNQTMARHYFGGASPLGKHVWFDGDDKPYEIAGVVSDAKYIDPGEPPQREIYFNAFQEGQMFSQFSLRTSVPPGSVAAEARQAVGEVAKNIPVARITTLSDQVNAAIVPERLIVMLSGAFGALGSLLAAIGIFGLLAYTVARRTSEIGVRMTLGATRGAVTAMVLREALATAGAGLAAGVPLVFAVRRLAAALLPDLRATAGPALMAAVAAMVAVALLAAWIPARRAARVDPMEALRCE